MFTSVYLMSHCCFKCTACFPGPKPTWPARLAPSADLVQDVQMTPVQGTFVGHALASHLALHAETKNALPAVKVSKSETT